MNSIHDSGCRSGCLGLRRSRRPHHALRATAVLAVAACLLTSTGCLVTASSKSYETGTRVPAGTLGQVTPGETTTAWIIATLGEPTRRDRIEDGEILVYHHQETETSRGSVFLIFKDTNRRKRTRTVYFETNNDVVQRYWIED